MRTEEVITPVFYVRGLNPPYNEGYIQIVNNIIRALATQNLTSVVFNYKYPIHGFKNPRVHCRQRYDQSIPIIDREMVVHGRKRSIAAYSSLIETIATPKFMSIERVLKSNGSRLIVNMVNCFRYPRVMAKALSKTPIVLHFYMSKTSNGPLVQTILDKADKIITSSQTVATNIQRIHNVETKKLAVLYPPIDVDFYKPLDKSQARRNLGISKEDQILLYVGKVVKDRFPEKIVLPALQDLIKENPKVKLLVFAPETRENLRRVAEIEANTRSLNLSGCLKIIVKNLSASEKSVLYGASDLFLYPSINPDTATEPPLTILEAMASGLPVISSDMPSVREIISDGNNGAVVSFLDDTGKRLSDKIVNYFRSAEAVIKMSFEARRSIEERMSLSVSGRQLIKVYEETFHR